MPKIDLSTAPTRSGTRYPEPFAAPCRPRHGLALGDAAGLTQFGVNLVTLPPGSWSSQRHWHSSEDEFVWIVAGELVLVTDAGEQVMRPGECAGFPAGQRDGHHLQNRSAQDATILVVGTRSEDDWGEYPDIDMMFKREEPGGPLFRHKNDTPYK